MNGCHNREPLADRRLVQDGWTTKGVTREVVVVSITNQMSKECQYTKSTLGQQDKGCDGCVWRAGHASRG